MVNLDQLNLKQESRVSTFNQMFRVSIVIQALILIGCQGQSTFKRQTNPTKDYQGVIEKSQMWKPGMGPRPAVVDFDNRQFFCAQDFTVTVNGPNDRRADFREGVAGAVDVSVVSASKAEFDVTLEGGPKEMKLRTLKKGSYQIAWTPTREDAKHYTLKIAIKAPELQKDCPVGFGQTIDAVVDPGPGAPTLNILNLADTMGYGVFREFQVEITDRAATPTKVPVIEIGADDRMINNVEAKVKNVSAKGAVSCETGKMKNTNDPTTWTYDCRFAPELLPNVGALVNTNQTVNAVFFMKGKSTATKEVTSQTSKSVQVVFTDERPKAEPTATVTPVVPVAPADVAPIAKSATPTAVAKAVNSGAGKVIPASAHSAPAEPAPVPAKAKPAVKAAPKPAAKAPAKSTVKTPSKATAKTAEARK